MFRQFKELQKSDDREGMVIQGFWESVSEFYRRGDANASIADLRKKAEESLNKLRCLEYASCWNMAKTENALMWNAYAARGIAIQTTVHKFTHAEQRSGIDRLRLRSQKIVYADHWNELKRRGYRHNGIPLNRLFLHAKRRAFAGEREVRFRISPFSFRPKVGGAWIPPDPQNCPPSFPVTFENLNWVDEGVAESSILASDVTAIRRLSDQRGVNFRLSEI